MTSTPPAGLAIPPSALRPETLRAVVEEYVTREGTDYGPLEYSLEQKVQHVLRQLERGEAQLTFDPASATVHIAPRHV